VHTNLFRFLGGVPKFVVCDLKAAVTNPDHEFLPRTCALEAALIQHLARPQPDRYRNSPNASKINDVGPLTPGRIIDLNERAMRHFDPSLQLGVIYGVRVRPLSGDYWIPGPVG